MTTPAKRKAPLYADQIEPPIYADDVASLMIFRLAPNANGKIMRKLLKLAWTPNPFELTEAQLAQRLPPGEYLVQARDALCQTLTQKKVTIEAAEPEDAPEEMPQAEAGGLFGGGGLGAGDGAAVQAVSADPDQILTVPGLAPVQQAEIALAQRHLQAEERRIADERRRLDADRAAARSDGKSTIEQFAMLMGIVNGQKPSGTDAEDRAHFYRAELDRKANELAAKATELIALRQAHLGEMEGVRAAHRAELDEVRRVHRAEVEDLRGKVRAADDELRVKMRQAETENLKLAKRATELEIDVENASVAPPESPSDKLVSMLMPHLPALLGMLRARGVDTGAMGAVVQAVGSGAGA